MEWFDGGRESEGRGEVYVRARGGNERDKR